jgi:nucleoside-diphosphate-sugar epimerase
MNKTISTTGWRPTIGIDEGIARTLAAFGKVA